MLDVQWKDAATRECSFFLNNNDKSFLITSSDGYKCGRSFIYRKHRIMCTKYLSITKMSGTQDSLSLPTSLSPPFSPEKAAKKDYMEKYHHEYYQRRENVCMLLKPCAVCVCVCSCSSPRWQCSMSTIHIPHIYPVHFVRINLVLWVCECVLN